MTKILPSLYRVFYASIFLYFARTTIEKIRIMFGDHIGIYHEDDSGYYALRLFGKYFITSDDSKRTALSLAMQLVSAVPPLSGHIELVEIDEPKVIDDLEVVSELGDKDQEKVAATISDFYD